MPACERFLGGQCPTHFAQSQLLLKHQRLHTGHTARVAEQDFVGLSSWHAARSTESFSQGHGSCLDKFEIN